MTPAKLLRNLTSIAIVSLLLIATRAMQAQTAPVVFLIVLENHNWLGSSGIAGNASAPYINNTLVPMGAVANNYFNPPGNHPSLPNYLWLEAGRNFGINADGPPSQYHQSTHAHFSQLLHNAGIHWRAYDESVSGTVCPLLPEGPADNTGGQLYQPRHSPQLYFDDMTNGESLTSSYCISHVRPLTQLGSDLHSGNIGRYNVITPNMCDDGHDTCGGSAVAHIDGWLKNTLPVIFNSAQYKAGQVTIFITADEAANGDGPIPLIVLGRGVKRAYRNEVRYTHSSLLRTLEEIFQVGPLLGGAASAPDLKDLFNVLP